MFDLRQAKFDWGQRVVAATDLFNDGSYPEIPQDALIVAAGTPGEIVQVGHHEEANVPIYIVEFGAEDSTARPCVVGVFEEEIALRAATTA